MKLFVTIFLILLPAFFISSCGDSPPFCHHEGDEDANAYYTEWYDRRDDLVFKLESREVVCKGRVGISRPKCRWK